MTAADDVSIATEPSRSAASSPETRLGRMRAWKAGLGPTAKLITEVAAGITAIVTFIVLILGFVENSDDAAVHIALTSPRMERGVELRDYIARTGFTPSPDLYPDEDLQMLGNVIYFTIETKALKDQPIYLRWSVFEADTDRRVAPEDKLQDQRGWPHGIFTSDHDSHRAEGEIFVPVPPNPGRYYIVLEAYNADEERRAHLVFEPFSG